MKAGLCFVMGCVPEGDAYEKLKARAVALGLKEGGDLHLRPFLYKEMASVYRRADVCIVPSRHESFGQTVLARISHRSYGRRPYLVA